MDEQQKQAVRAAAFVAELRYWRTARLAVTPELADRAYEHAEQVAEHFTAAQERAAAKKASAK